MSYPYSSSSAVDDFVREYKDLMGILYIFGHREGFLWLTLQSSFVSLLSPRKLPEGLIWFNGCQVSHTFVVVGFYVQGKTDTIQPLHVVPSLLAGTRIPCTLQRCRKSTVLPLYVCTRPSLVGRAPSLSTMGRPIARYLVADLKPRSSIARCRPVAPPSVPTPSVAFLRRWSRLTSPKPKDKTFGFHFVSVRHSTVLRRSCPCASC